MTCNKATFVDLPFAEREAARVAQLNGHAMRVYHCGRCNCYHLTSAAEGVNKVLPWKSPRLNIFTAQFGDGEFLVQRNGIGGWIARTPAGHWSGPQETILKAKEWCEAASFLPPERWPTC